MCFSAPPMPKTPPVPKRDDNASLAQQARMTTLASRNVSGTLTTSPLGDGGFGTNVRKTTLLGTTAGMI
jgi:hypothetical protein